LNLQAVYGQRVYDYTDESNNVYQIKLSEIAVDTLTTNAKGFIAADDKFLLSPAFTFTGMSASRQDRRIFCLRFGGEYFTTAAG
jgi:hypothetical protein